MRRAGLVCLAAAAAACGPPAGTPRTPASTTGSITVLSRDHDTGEIVQNANLALRGPVARTLVSSKYGFATFDGLPPGTYDLVATFAAQPFEIDKIDVHANQTAYLDVAFTLGRPDPIRVTYGDARSQAIEHYRPAGMRSGVARIEGTVVDVTTHARVPGAVVTAARADDPNVLQAVTDDAGRYRFDDVPPGTYAVSANYSIAGRGSVEQRRSDLALGDGDAVIVPLAIELSR